MARCPSADGGWCTAELLRLQGEQQLASAALAEADALFQRGIEVAAQQQALAWELRCSTSLACSGVGCGQFAQAHTLLAGVISRFTEGAGSADPQRAAALIRLWR